jgi:hypothetical protein
MKREIGFKINYSIETKNRGQILPYFLSLSFPCFLQSFRRAVAAKRCARIQRQEVMPDANANQDRNPPQSAKP